MSDRVIIRRMVAVVVGGFVIFGFGSQSVCAKPKKKNPIPVIVSPKQVDKPTGTDPTKEQPKPLPAAPDNSVCFFNLRPHGDPDAQYYSMGFSMALSDRLRYAPTTLTMHVPGSEVAEALKTRKFTQREGVSDKLGLDVAKGLGAKYCLMGDFDLQGSTVAVSIQIGNTGTGKLLPVIKATGSISDLPTIETDLTQKIVAAMNLCVSEAQLDELKKANFAEPRVLLLAGRSLAATDPKEKENWCWQAMDIDTKSILPVQLVLRVYVSSQMTSEELAANSRLMQIVRDTTGQFPDNPTIRLQKAQMLCAKLNEPNTGKEILAQLLKTDSLLIDAHDWLEFLAEQTGDVQGVISEAQTMTLIWPTRAKYYSYVANALMAKAANARQGKAYANMSKEEEQTWYENSMQAVDACRMATRLDKDCAPAWHNLLNLGRELSLSDDTGQAFRELTRIDPKDWQAYFDYAVCFSPQWKGLPSQQEAVFALANKAFGKDSEQALLLQTWVLWQNSDKANHVKDVADCVDKIIALETHPAQEILSLKYELLRTQRRYSEMIDVSQKAYQLYPSAIWRFNYATDLARCYKDTNDEEKLRKANELLAAFVAECPNSADGHLNYGWCLEQLGVNDQAQDEYDKADALMQSGSPEAVPVSPSGNQPKL